MNVDLGYVATRRKRILVEQWELPFATCQVWEAHGPPGARHIQHKYAACYLDEFGKKQWLREPETDFETVSGARTAILIFMETLK